MKEAKYDRDISLKASADSAPPYHLQHADLKSRSQLKDMCEHLQLCPIHITYTPSDFHFLMNCLIQ